MMLANAPHKSMVAIEALNDVADLTAQCLQAVVDGSRQGTGRSGSTTSFDAGSRARETPDKKHRNLTLQGYVTRL